MRNFSPLPQAAPMTTSLETMTAARPARHGCMTEQLPSLLPIFLEHFFKDGDDLFGAGPAGGSKVSDDPRKNVGGLVSVSPVSPCLTRFVSLIRVVWRVREAVCCTQARFWGSSATVGVSEVSGFRLGRGAS